MAVTALTGGISDADGMTGVPLSFRWEQEAGAAWSRSTARRAATSRRARRRSGNRLRVVVSLHRHERHGRERDVRRVGGGRRRGRRRAGAGRRPGPGHRARIGPRAGGPPVAPGARDAAVRAAAPGRRAASAPARVSGLARRGRRTRRRSRSRRTSRPGRRSSGSACSALGRREGGSRRGRPRAARRDRVPHDAEAQALPLPAHGAEAAAPAGRPLPHRGARRPEPLGARAAVEPDAPGPRGEGGRPGLSAAARGALRGAAGRAWPAAVRPGHRGHPRAAVERSPLAGGSLRVCPARAGPARSGGRCGFGPACGPA